jgi:hypothetical protein
LKLEFLNRVADLTGNGRHNQALHIDSARRTMTAG